MKTNKSKTIILIGALIALTFSGFLNFFLYRQLRLYYTLLYAIELDPLGLSYFQNEAPRQSGDKPIVVFFGDSRASQWITPITDDFTFINRGVGNQTSAQVAGRFDAHIKPLQPDVVIIQVCVNDLKTIPLFPGKEQEIISNCKTNLQKIVQDSLALNATIIVTTIIPPTGKVPLTRRLAWSNNVYKAVDEVNAYILNMADEHVIVFDAASIISDRENKMKIEYSNDFLHLNKAGYQALNLELVKILEGIK